MENLYTIEAAENLIRKYQERGATAIQIDEGCLGIGNWICYGNGLKTAIIEERAISCYSSGQAITMFNKRIPNKYKALIEEYAPDYAEATKKSNRRGYGRYEYYQPNEKDLKDNQGDCVIRALTKALGRTWREVFTDLIPYAIEAQAMPNNEKCYEEYLKANGYKWIGIKATKGSKRPTVDSFTKEHETGTYILQVAHHLVASVEGKYYDTWNSGSKSLYGYWTR